MIKLQEVTEELWDKHSEHIDDDLSSLEMVAGRDMMHKSSFFKAAAEIIELAKQQLGNNEVVDVRELKQRFYNTSNCYADVDNGLAVPAMTFEAVCDLFRYFKLLPTPTIDKP